MQKLNTLFVLAITLMVSVAATAQTAVQADLDYLNKAKDVQISNIYMDGTPVVPTGDRPEASTAIVLDYGTTGGDTSSFFWTVNRDFTGGNQLDLAGVLFDSLIDNNGITYNTNNYYSKLDSIRFPLRVRKGSPATTEDTLLVSVFELAGSTVVWQDTLILTQGVASATGNFVFARFQPDITICDNQWAVRLDFYGSVLDTLDVIATFQVGQCLVNPDGTYVCGVEASVNPNSSFFGLYNNAGTRITTPYLDCSPANMAYDPGQCEDYFIQNIWIESYATLVDRPLDYTVNTTKDAGTGTGTAALNIADDIDVDIIWASLDGNNSNLPAIANLVGLNADRLLLGLSIDGFNCGGLGIQDTIVIERDNVGIDQELAAGISSLFATPNPNNGAFNLEMSLENRDNVRVQVLATDGKVLYTETFNQVNTLSQSINLNNVAAGIYTVQVTTSRGSAYERIMVK